MVTDSTQRGSGQGVPRVTRSTPKAGRQLQIMVRGRPLTVERIRRVEKRARRAARARRRFIVSVVLLLGSVTAWALVGFDRLHWGVAVVPSAMLIFVLFLGQRAARAARRADARWHATVRTARQEATQARALANGGPYAPRNRAQVTGLATHGSDTATQAIPRVGEASRDARKNVLDEILDGSKEPEVVEVPVDAEAAAGAKAGDTDGAPADDVAARSTPKQQLPSGRAWDPVPVPLPTYVTKPAAPPRQPAALPSFAPRQTAGTAGSAPGGAPAGVGGSGASGTAGGSGADAVAEDELLRGAPPRMKSETLATPLEEILARRRAAG